MKVKKLLAALLAVAMVLGMMTVPAFAEETENLDGESLVTASDEEISTFAAADRFYSADGSLFCLVNDDETSVTVRLSSDFKGEITIPKTVTNTDSGKEYTVTALDRAVNYTNKTITAVTIQADIKTLPRNFFNNYEKLESVVLPDTLNAIGEVAFSDCKALASINLPVGLESIGYGAFERSGLTEITLPSTVTTLGHRVFSNMYALKKADLSELSITTLPDSIFACSASYAVSIEEVKLPETLTAIGMSAFEKCTGLTDIDIPDTVESIGRYAFKGCTGLTTITLPGSLNDVAYSAFDGCSNLETVTVPASVTEINFLAFTNCPKVKFSFSEDSQYTSDEQGVIYNTDKTELIYCPGTVTAYTIPSTVKKIAGGAFGGGKIQSIVIPANVETIGGSAFRNCSALRTLTIEDGDKMLDIQNMAFERSGLNTVTFGNRPVTIADGNAVNNGPQGNGVFFNCSGLTTVNFGEGLTKIGRQAFFGTKIKELALPASLKTIGEEAFFGYNTGMQTITSLTFAEGSQLESIGVRAFQNQPIASELKIPATVTEIGSEAFRGTKLPALSFEEGCQLTEIGYNSFENCKNLKNAVIPDSVEAIRSSAFSGCSGLATVTISKDSNLKLIDNSAFRGCSALTNIYLPDGLKTISSNAFLNCKSLESVDIPDSVIFEDVYKGYSSFSGCSSLTSVTLPENMTVIPRSMFYGCSALTEIVIPSGVKEIGATAFNGCTNLTKVVVLTGADADLKIDNSAFKGTDGITFYTSNKDVAAFVESEATNPNDTHKIAPVEDAGVQFPATLNARLSLYADRENSGVFNLYLTPVGGEIKAFADLEFYVENALSTGKIGVEVMPGEKMNLAFETNAGGKTRYLLYVKPTDGENGGVITIPANGMVIGKVVLSGYGAGTLSITDAYGNGEIPDSIYDPIILETAEGNVNASVQYDLKPARQTLTVNVAFPNGVTDNAAAYQDMKATVSGGDLTENIVLNFGSDGVAQKDGGYSFTQELTQNVSYTVTLEGAGYRTVRYTVNMNDDKTLNFWNNVKDEATVVEVGKDASAVKSTFLAGDIVKDNIINLYDLSAVVSYFGTENLAADYPAYAKYDLNRDGKIDSKDVAMVLVSWGN